MDGWMDSLLSNQSADRCNIVGEAHSRNSIQNTLRLNHYASKSRITNTKLITETKNNISFKK